MNCGPNSSIICVQLKAYRHLGQARNTHILISNLLLVNVGLANDHSIIDVQVKTVVDVKVHRVVGEDTTLDDKIVGEECEESLKLVTVRFEVHEAVGLAR